MTHADWLDVVNEIGQLFRDGAEERDAADEFVAAHYDVLKQRGLLEVMIPADLGGGGASYSTVATLLHRLAYYDASTSLALSMHQHLIAAQLFNHRRGRPAPLLPRVAAERLVLVSTGARDWLESNGSARAVEGGFRVNARKAFASGSPAGDILLTSAPFEDPSAGWQVLHFAVPMRAEGVLLDDDWRAHGMRGTGSCTVVLDDVFVPESAIALRRPRGAFHDIFNVVAAVALPLIVGVYVGVAERAADTALELARPNAGDATVQWSVGEMRTALVTARVLHERMVALARDLEFEPSIELTDEVLVLKAQAAAAAERTVQRGVEAVGGPAFYRRTELERLLRDVRAGHYHPLPAKQQARFTGRLALGLEPVESWTPPRS